MIESLLNHLFQNAPICRGQEKKASQINWKAFPNTAICINRGLILIILCEVWPQEYLIVPGTLPLYGGLYYTLYPEECF